MINMMPLNSFYIMDGEALPLNSGRWALQSQGAEIFFKDIKVKYLDEIPRIIEDAIK